MFGLLDEAPKPPLDPPLVIYVLTNHSLYKVTRDAYVNFNMK